MCSGAAENVPVKATAPAGRGLLLVAGFKGDGYQLSPPASRLAAGAPQCTDCSPRSPHFSGPFPRSDWSSWRSSASSFGACIPSGRGIPAHRHIHAVRRNAMLFEAGRPTVQRVEQDGVGWKTSYITCWAQSLELDANLCTFCIYARDIKPLHKPELVCFILEQWTSLRDRFENLQHPQTHRRLLECLASTHRR